MDYDAPTDSRNATSRSHLSIPHRSRADRKIAGVAGGLGRSLGIDPILIRVAFAVLALFGGSGVLLYCLGWLLMPADGDEVSAAAALAGKGRSSASPALTIALIIIALASAGSVFSWGIPFWPVLIAAAVVFVLLAHRRAERCPRHGGHDGRRDFRRDFGRAAIRADWSARADEFAERVSAWGNRIGEQASRWADEWTGRRPSTPGEGASRSASAAEYDDGSGHSDAGEAGRSDDPAAGAASGAGAARNPDAAAEPTEPAGPPSPDELLTMGLAGESPGGRRTPPAWDPLGAAPFAWDLPEPGPDPAAAAAYPSDGDRAGAGRMRGAGIGRLFLGVALLLGGLLAGGVFAGWWSLGWATIAGIALGVIGLGLIAASFRGRGGRRLIGPGIILAVLTLGFTVSGVTGTTGFGTTTWKPVDAAALQSSYQWNAGQATLDLSAIGDVPHDGTTVTAAVRAGQLTVLVPSGVSVEANCYARLGAVDCLGSTGSGVRTSRSGHAGGTDGASGGSTGSPAGGVLTLDVSANTGRVVVRHG